MSYNCYLVDLRNIWAHSMGNMYLYECLQINMYMPVLQKCSLFMWFGCDKQLTLIRLGQRKLFFFKKSITHYPTSKHSTLPASKWSIHYNYCTFENCWLFFWWCKPNKHTVMSPARITFNNWQYEPFSLEIS